MAYPEAESQAFLDDGAEVLETLQLGEFRSWWVVWRVSEERGETIFKAVFYGWIGKDMVKDGCKSVGCCYSACAKEREGFVF